MPAFIVLEKVTSLAVMVIGALVVDMVPELVTLPEPLEVIVTPVVPDTLALTATAPLEPEDCIVNELLAMVWEMVMLPLALRLSVPTEMAPVVVMWALVAVVVK